MNRYFIQIMSSSLCFFSIFLCLIQKKRMLLLCACSLGLSFSQPPPQRSNGGFLLFQFLAVLLIWIAQDFRDGRTSIILELACINIFGQPNGTNEGIHYLNEAINTMRSKVTTLNLHKRFRGFSSAGRRKYVWNIIATSFNKHRIIVFLSSQTYVFKMQWA